MEVKLIDVSANGKRLAAILIVKTGKNYYVKCCERHLTTGTAITLELYLYILHEFHICNLCICLHRHMDGWMDVCVCMLYAANELSVHCKCPENPSTYQIYVVCASAIVKLIMYILLYYYEAFKFI